MMRALIPIRYLAVILAFAAAVPGFAGEVAVLRNGFSIRHERREVVGEVTRLYVTADGSSFVDIPTAEIEHYEAAPDVAVPASGAQLPASRTNPISRTSPFTAGSARAPAVIDLNEVVTSASGRYRLDPDLVNSVIKAESGFNSHAISPKGAQGLMQLMPGTASQLGVPNAFDPQANVEGGTKYLRELLERYNFDIVKALAAYNAGPQRVEQFGGVPPFYETRAYVARVVRDFNRKKKAKPEGAGFVAKAAPAKRTPAKPPTAPRKAQSSALAKVNSAQPRE
jgi:hypothetical protein